ncbi:hypothetical protein [Streptomyces sp. NBC_00299]|uniref:hypothetical protein n=1 Tax=Streptomyces sp. NBC_00299 TaxID=2975705 RepID=UPI002E2BA4C8|nr:hypothetical protein [Streptomyces sp. NBC_00299]
MSASHFVARRTTKGVVTRTTKPARPEAEYDRYHAWQLLFTPQQRPKDWPKQYDALDGVPGLVAPTGYLSDIAAKYDRMQRHLEAEASEALTETELLAGLLVVRALRDKLLEDEVRLIGAARRRKVTWARIAHAIEVRSRQAAERRFLQLRSDIDDLHGSVLTQHERVAYARDQRERRAERSWTVDHAAEIQTLAHQLLSLTDLQSRADHSPRALKAHHDAVHEAELAGLPAPSLPRSPWPERLRAAAEDNADIRASPLIQSASDLNGARLKATRVADAIHLLYGLVTHAADPGNVDLTDLPELEAAAAALYQQAELHAVRPQRQPRQRGRQPSPGGA